MLTKIKKWGNSQGIRIPKVFLENLRISEEDEVEIISDQEKIVITKARMREHLTIKDRLENFYNQPIEEILLKNQDSPQKIDWGKPVGKETW
jgi:antitoxin MazE